MELLLALAGVAVLLALLLPVYQGTRAASMTAACVANMRQIGVGLIAYAADHEQYLPPLRREYAPPYRGAYERLYWTSLVAEYLQFPLREQVGQRVLRCPLSPEFKPEAGHNYTYGLHYGKVSAYDRLDNGVSNRSAPASYYARGYVQKLPLLGNRVFLMADCDGRDYPMVHYAGAEGNWPLNQDRAGTGRPDSSSVLGNVPHNGIRFGHQGRRANFLFADGSIRSLTIAYWAANEDGLWGRPWR